MDIYQGVSRNTSMPAKFQQMIDCGIVEVGRDDGCSIYSLTESSWKIAEHLECIEDLFIRNLTSRSSSHSCNGCDHDSTPVMGILTSTCTTNCILQDTPHHPDL